MPSHTGHHIYRCTPATRNRAYQGPHVARQAVPVEEFIEKLVVGRLSRAGCCGPGGGRGERRRRGGAAGGSGGDPQEPGGDGRRPGVGPDLPGAAAQATEAGDVRLDEIGGELDSAARENVLAPLIAAENAASVWETLDISRKRAVIKTLMTVTLHSPGRGPRRPFDPATVKVTWRNTVAA